MPVLSSPPFAAKPSVDAELLQTTLMGKYGMRIPCPAKLENIAQEILGAEYARGNIEVYYDKENQSVTLRFLQVKNSSPVAAPLHSAISAKIKEKIPNLEWCRITGGGGEYGLSTTVRNYTLDAVAVGGQKHDTFTLGMETESYVALGGNLPVQKAAGHVRLSASFKPHAR